MRRATVAGAGALGAVALLLVVVTLSGAADCAGASTSARSSGLSVALTVSQHLGVARHGEVVTVGVPLARDPGITATDDLRVLDGGGAAVPAQFLVTGRWGGAPDDPSLPIRWLLVDFVADAPASGTAAYTLVDDGGTSPAGDVAVTQDDTDALVVETGAGRFTVDKETFDLLASAVVDGRELVRRGSTSGIRATSTAGVVYSSRNEPPRRVAVETAGAVRTTVRVDGRLAATDGARLLEYTARLSFFTGRSDVRVLLTVRNPRRPVVRDGQPQVYFIGSPNSADFRDLTVRVGRAAGERPRLRLGGLAGRTPTTTRTLKVYQDSSGTSHWARHRGHHPRPQSYVSFRGYRVHKNGSRLLSGDQIQPWLRLSGASGGLAVATREFWQQFPKALRGTRTGLSLALFPREYAGNFRFRCKEQKTHQFALVFHGSAVPASAPAGTTMAQHVQSAVAACQDPLLAAAAPEYYRETGAFGRVAPPIDPDGDPAPPADLAAYEELNRSTIAGSPTNLRTVIAAADFYGWQDYGDVPIDYENGGTGTFNMKYNFDHGMYLQWVRTGDRRWLDHATAGGRHVADLDVLHYDSVGAIALGDPPDPLPAPAGEPDAWWDGGYFGHSWHDESSNGNPNRNEGGLHPDVLAGAPGLFLCYHLTGYEPAREAALEIAENTRWRYENSFGRGSGEGYAEAYDGEADAWSPRPFGMSLLVLTEAQRATGDESYFETMEWLIGNSQEAVAPFLTEPVPGDHSAAKVFTWDLLELGLGRYLDLCAETGRADASGAQGQLVAMTEQEATEFWRTDGDGNAGVPYMWRRDGTAIGWEGYEVPVNVCDWQLLTADCLTYGSLYGGDATLLDRAAEAFATGANPDLEWYEPAYTATKEATNNANFGQVYLSERP